MSVIYGVEKEKEEEDPSWMMWEVENLAGVSTHEWFHLGTTWRKDGNLKVYVNGFVAAETSNRIWQTNKEHQVIIRESKMQLGKDAFLDKYYGNFTIDELLIWNYEKSELQMEQLTSMCKYQTK